MECNEYITKEKQIVVKVYIYIIFKKKGAIKILKKLTIRDAGRGGEVGKRKE